MGILYRHALSVKPKQDFLERCLAVLGKGGTILVCYLINAQRDDDPVLLTPLLLTNVLKQNELAECAHDWDKELARLYQLGIVKVEFFGKLRFVRLVRGRLQQVIKGEAG